MTERYTGPQLDKIFAACRQHGVTELETGDLKVKFVFQPIEVKPLRMADIAGELDPTEKLVQGRVDLPEGPQDEVTEDVLFHSAG